MKSFDEIIRFAIRNEADEAEFYEKLAEHSESADQKKFLLEQAKEEQEHKRRLEKILARNRLPDGKTLYPDEDLKFSDYLIVRETTGESISFEDALLMAANREKVIERFYRDMANVATDAELKETFLFLAEQEAKHKNLLEQAYDDTLKEG